MTTLTIINNEPPPLIVTQIPGVGPPGAGSPAQVLAALAGVDGAGSGLDADLLDGLHAVEFDPAGAAAAVEAALSGHATDTTAVHGIADTAALETTSGAQAKIDAAIAVLVGVAPEILDTFAEVAARLADDEDAAAALTAAVAGKQPLSTNLTALAAIAAQPYGRALLALLDAPAARAALGLGSSAVSTPTALAQDPAFSSRYIASGLRRSVAVVPSGKVIEATTTYDAFGCLLLCRNGDIVRLYRQGAVHVGVGDFGVTRLVRSTDGGLTWGAPVTIATRANRDMRGIAATVTTTGRIVVLLTNCIPSAVYGASSAWTLETFHSDDHGVTWSPRVTLIPETDDAVQSYGAVIQVDGGRLLAPYYIIDANTVDYSVWLAPSDDDGETWGAPYMAFSGVNGGTAYNETSFAYVGNRNVVALARRQGPPPGYGHFVSRDNGATFTYIGLTTFDTSAGAGVRPCWLSPFNAADGSVQVACYYINTTAAHAYPYVVIGTVGAASPGGRVPNLASILDSVDGWQPTTNRKLPFTVETYPGYPTAVRYNDSPAALVAFDHEIAAGRTNTYLINHIAGDIQASRFTPPPTKRTSGMWFYAVSALSSFAAPDLTGHAGVNKILIPAGFAITDICLEVTGAGSAGAVMRLGCYEWPDHAQNPLLVADAGTVDCTTIGFKTLAMAVPASPYPWWALLVSVLQGSPVTPPTVRLMQPADDFAGSLNQNALLLSTVGGKAGWIVAGLTTGPLPAVGSSPGELLTVTRLAIKGTQSVMP